MVKDDSHEDEGHKKAHKKHFNQGKRSPLPQEMKTYNENGANRSKDPTNEDLNTSVLGTKDINNPRQKLNEGNKEF